MTVRAMFVLPNEAISVDEPFRSSASQLQYPHEGNTYVVRRIRQGRDARSGFVYEIYAEIEVSEAEAIARAAAWNRQMPNRAVPPEGFQFA